MRQSILPLSSGLSLFHMRHNQAVREREDELWVERMIRFADQRLASPRAESSNPAEEDVDEEPNAQAA